ncbi:pentatricopeptide repeat-containing protein At3g03580-like [Chenopodium quinoa]|nr:pentatricopeptide repeat-containing protein At3g03580-like [Chenopodium quinoa]
MFGENVVQWTSKIQSYSQKGLFNRALSLFLSMRRAGVKPNEVTFSTTLTVCAQSIHKSFGLSLHSLILKKGYQNQLFVCGGLISMYGSFRRIVDARQVFDEMPDRDEVVCNLMISKYSQNGFCYEACGLFCGMVNGGVYWRGFVSDFSLASVLNACAHLGCCEFGESVHCFVIKLGFDSNVFVGSSLVGMYSSYEELGSARAVFDRLGTMDVVVWNTMITGYAHNGYEEEAIELFLEMEIRGLTPNYTTFSAVVDAASVMPDETLGRKLHAKSLKFGILSDVYLGTAIVDMYSKFLIMTDAKKAFSEMEKKNVISYNALITGYGLIGDHENAVKSYTLLRLRGMKPDACTFIGLLTSCSTSCAFVVGERVHSDSIKLGLDRDVLVRNSIVNFYSKCGLINSAIKAFESAQGSEIVSWTAIISGLVQNNEHTKALEVFCEMHRLSEKADEFSSSSAIKAVANLAAVAQGRHLHGYVQKVGLTHHIFVGSALIDMYSKCGMVEDAHKLFSEMPEKNAVSWNSMIAGFAQNGYSDKALHLFHEMVSCGVLPTSGTFVGVLLACFHAGLVQEGRRYLQLMESHYGVSPSVEHYSCMVNLLGHAGYVKEAEEFLLSSPFKGDYEMWKSLLTSCEAHRDFDVAARVAEYCLHLNPNDSSTNTILSNIYASKQLWSEVERTRDSMKVADIVKEPGCSWI